MYLLTRVIGKQPSPFAPQRNHSVSLHNSEATQRSAGTNDDLLRLDALREVVQSVNVVRRLSAPVEPSPVSNADAEWYALTLPICERG